MPTYLVGGLHEPYSEQIRRMLERLQVPRKGLLGPWLHSYPNAASPNGLDWAHEEVGWSVHWLVGEENTGIMGGQMLRVFMPYRTRREAMPGDIPGRWVAEDRWPTGRLGERFYFNADGIGETATEGEALRAGFEPLSD